MRGISQEKKGGGLQHRRRGFTLIEVTLAIAIVALALVSLMGMLPTGMKSLVAAHDAAIEARIHQSILGELLLTSWEKQGGQAPIDMFDRTRFYDDQGIEVPANSQEFTYQVRITIIGRGDRIPPSAGGGNSPGIILPGDTVASDDLRLAVVEIAPVRDSAFNFDTGSLKIIKTYRSIIARMGQTFKA